MPFVGADVGRSQGRRLAVLREEGKKMKATFSALIILALASGCGMSLDKVIKEAGKDRASWCGRFVAGYGVAALVPGPGIPAGGYYGDAYVGRSNEPGSTVKVDASGCQITHGKSGGAAQTKEP